MEINKKQEREEQMKKILLDTKRAQHKKLAIHIFWWLVALIGLGLLIWGLALLASQPTTADKAGSLQDPITANDWQEGNPNAQTTLVEYGDFQCPACGQFYTVVHQLTQQYNDKLLFVFREYPLTTIHPNADLAALAAEAAGQQGKFWPMYDALYSNQSQWSESTQAQNFINGYARQLGLDMQKFSAALADPATEAKIQADIASGDRAGVDATPSFYLNGKKLTNLQTYDDLKTDLQQALASH